MRMAIPIGSMSALVTCRRGCAINDRHGQERRMTGMRLLAAGKSLKWPNYWGLRVSRGFLGFPGQAMAAIPGRCSGHRGTGTAF
jgi:hypothetical protein